MLLLISLLKYQLRNVFYEIYTTTITHENTLIITKNWNIVYDTKVLTITEFHTFIYSYNY